MSESKVLNDSLFESDKIDAFRKEFDTAKPFNLVRVQSFLNKQFISKLESSLDENITFAKKDNDLFRFYQSYGLQELPETTAIQHLIKSLYSKQFIDLLFKITGIKVGNKPDLFASCYNDTSYLLCHDDQIEDRKVAFILYLVPENWNEKDGGALNIYDSYTVNDNNEHKNSNSSNSSISVNIFPENKPLKQLIPIRNSVVIFKVSDKSFHAVDEVLTNDKNRIAIGGWWHDETDDTSNMIRKIQVPDPMIEWNDIIQSKRGNDLLQKWLNPTYLKEESLTKLQEKFLEQSHLTLISFLKEELYYKLLKQMFSIQCGDDKNGVCWKLKGPIHRRLYYSLQMLDGQEKSGVDCCLLIEFKELMESMEWKLFIHKITCLDLLKYNVEMRKFDHRHYTIAHDLDRFKDIPGLDVNLQFIENEENGWDPSCGGSIYYTLSGGMDNEQDDGKMVMEEEEKGGNEDDDLNIKEKECVEMEESKDDGINEDEDEMSIEEDENIIISVHTFPNTLSIAYRSEAGVMSFVKYINHNAPCSKIDFNQIWTVDDNDESDQGENEKDVNEKKRKLNDNSVDSINEPQQKRQKM